MAKRDHAQRIAAFVKDRLLQLGRYMKDHSEDYVEYSKELNWENEDAVMLEHLKLALQQEGRRVILQGDVLSYCPPYDVRNYDELLKRLKDFHDEGLGGMRRDHLQESYKNADNDVDRLEREGRAFVVKRKGNPPVEIVYYRESGLDVKILQEVKEKWRAINVEGKHDKDIEDALIAARLVPMHVEPPDEDLKKKKRKRKKEDRAQTRRAVAKLLADTNPLFATGRRGGGGDDEGGGGGGGDDGD